MGRAKSDVKDQENEYYRKVYVQWWVLVRKGVKNDEELCHNCWLNKWKCNHVDPNNGSKYLVLHFLSQLKEI
jgi:hypothetical protein